ncbi:MAG: uroporphyrinogen decarboxylase (URO-D) [Agathobacter sp.]|nr:uroporphyrinogen decarboxylase (URO-D) [Agathobacter sp.]
MTAKEQLLAMLAGEKVEGIIKEWDPFFQLWDPIAGYVTPARPGATVKDIWGVTLRWDLDQPGVMPMEGEGYTVCPEITEWRDTVIAPDLDKVEFDYSGVLGQKAAGEAMGKLTMGFTPIGIFELLHNLMGFEDCLMNFILEPEEMHELIDYLTEFRLKYFKLMVENFRPDVIQFHDDWGAKTNLFMSPDTWREFIKPAYKKIYGYLKSEGIIIMHHADSFLEPIIEDMVELGIDIWQGALPQNDLVALQKKINGRMIIMGGIDAAIIDHKDIDEEIVRNEVRRACAEYLPGGHFIPCLTYGGKGSIYPQVDEIIMDELAKIEERLIG